MSENYIVINGKKAELTPEQLKALGLERETSPFARVSEGNEYHYINKYGYVQPLDESDMGAIGNELHKIANYCTDREMMEQRALHETLNRLLWRYSMEHKGNEVDWSSTKTKYRITYDQDDHKWRVDTNGWIETLGAVYFATMGIAQDAIREIIKPFMAEHPDFKL